MNINYKKIIFSVLAILSIIGYGIFAFAAAPSGGYDPGSILDPLCAPGDTDCFVKLKGVSIGDIIGNSPDLNGVLYTNATGQLSTDALFTRDSTTKETNISRSDNASYNTYTYLTAQLLIMDENVIPTGTYEEGETITGDTSGVTGVISKVYGTVLLLSSSSGTFQTGETITGATSGATGGVVDTFFPNSFTIGQAFTVFDLFNSTLTGVSGTITNISGNTVTVSATGSINQNEILIDSFPPSNALFVEAVNTINGSLSFTTGFKTNNDLNGSGLNGSAITVNNSGSTFGIGTFLDGLGGVRSGWFADSTINLLPGSVGTAGQALVTDGAGDLSWKNVSSPISVGTSGNTLYSSGLTGTGQGNVAFGNNVFLGANAGANAFNVGFSNFIGDSAGINATHATFSNFFGQYAGRDASNADNSNFFGAQAGNSANNADNSNFFGRGAGAGAHNAEHSNFFGDGSGDNATNASFSNFFGSAAGYTATSASYSNFFGSAAGYAAVNATSSNFFGNSAGREAVYAAYSNFLGQQAGYSATNATNSNFIGTTAGQGATNAYNSNFFGAQAGNSATDAFNSNFLGNSAGNGATNASVSNFFGSNAGYNAPNASNSIFIGTSAGSNDIVDNTTDADDFSILIGNNTSTGGSENSIALGSYATNTASNQFMIGSVTRPINDMVINGAGFTTCSVNTVSGAGISCSSDARLKKNIIDLSTATLDTLTQIKTINFNWINGTDTANHIGFLAQDLQQYYPELVSTASNGYLQVNYAGMTPILVEAIREMNFNITEIGIMEKPNSWRDSLIEWFGNASNGIANLFTKTSHTETLCVGTNGDETCITKSQLDQLLNGSSSGSIAPVSVPVEEPVVTPTPAPAPNPIPDGTPVSDTGPVVDQDSDTAPVVDPITIDSDNSSDVDTPPAPVSDPVTAQTE